MHSVGAARPRLTYLISTSCHILKSFSTCGGMQIYFPILLSLPANKLAREQLREEQLGRSRSAKQNQMSRSRSAKQNQMSGS